MILHQWQFLLIAVAGWVNREQQAIIEYFQDENRVLREQLGTKRLRFSDAHTQRRSLAAKAKTVGRKELQRVGCIVTPDTLLRWYRQLISRKYDGSAKRGPGRPATPKDVRELITQMARKMAVGVTRIQGALKNLGYNVCRTTVRHVMLENGLDPTPQRKKGMSWKEFLRVHWDQIAAADFFTIEVMTLRGLIRYHVLFVMEVATRKVVIAGITPTANGEWMTQVARNLTDACDGFLIGKRYMRDRFVIPYSQE